MRGGVGVVERSCAGRNMVEGAGLGVAGAVRPAAGVAARGVARTRGTAGCTVGCMSREAAGVVLVGVGGR